MSDQSDIANSSLFLRHGGEWWDFWLIIAVIAAAFAACAVGVATAGSIISHKREANSAKSELDRFKVETAGKIADASTRIAEANARAVEAQLALEKFRAPRRLSDKQGEKLIGILNGFHGTKVKIWILTGSSDISNLAEEFINIFNKSNWLVGGATSLSGRSFSGVLVSVKKGVDANNQANTIVSYLNSIGVQSSMLDPYVDDGSLQPSSNVFSFYSGDPDLLVIVGSKQ